MKVVHTIAIRNLLVTAEGRGEGEGEEGRREGKERRGQQSFTTLQGYCMENG